MIVAIVVAVRRVASVVKFAPDLSCTHLSTSSPNITGPKPIRMLVLML